MKKIIIGIACLFPTILGFSQIQIKSIKADITGNNEVDILAPNDSSIIMKIDNKKYEILIWNFGFESLSELTFKNKIITISGGNNGTGAFSWIYKFRHNSKTQKIELIGFDSFSKWVSGNITKSVNLVTEKYEIILEAYNYEKDKMEVSKFTGKAKFDKVALTEIKESSFDKLNELGQQYTPQ